MLEIQTNNNKEARNLPYKIMIKRTYTAWLVTDDVNDKEHNPTRFYAVWKEKFTYEDFLKLLLCNNSKIDMAATLKKEKEEQEKKEYHRSHT